LREHFCPGLIFPGIADEDIAHDEYSIRRFASPLCTARPKAQSLGPRRALWGPGYYYRKCQELPIFLLRTPQRHLGRPRPHRCGAEFWQSLLVCRDSAARRRWSGARVVARGDIPVQRPDAGYVWIIRFTVWLQGSLKASQNANGAFRVHALADDAGHTDTPIGE
jgi:hypothetical protein